MKHTFHNQLKKQGLKIHDLALALGVTERQTWNYLHSRSIPKGEKAILFANILRVPLEDVLRRSA